MLFFLLVFIIDLSTLSLILFQVSYMRRHCVS